MFTNTQVFSEIMNVLCSTDHHVKCGQYIQSPLYFKDIVVAFKIQI